MKTVTASSTGKSQMCGHGKSEMGVTLLLQELVRSESVNPSLDPRGSGEQKVIAVLEQFCRKRSIDFSTQKVLNGRSNFLARIRGRNPDKKILFIAHMDTVPVDEWSEEQFSGAIRDGLLHGRGSCDTKGSLAAMMWALSTFRPGELDVSVVVAGSVDEEHRKLGAQAIAESGEKFEAAVVGEPTELELVVAHKGSVRWEISVQGKSAHTSKPHLGVNAITSMAHVVLALDGLNERLKERADPLVGAPTLTITLIEGGLEVTTVPPLCRITIDRRLIPGEEPESALAEAGEVLGQLQKGLPQLHFAMSEPFFVDHAPQSSAGTRIAIIAEEACQRIANKPGYRGVPYGTDASKLSRTGIPCVILGPGSIDQAHTPNEYVEIAQLTRAVEIYREIMKSY